LGVRHAWVVADAAMAMIRVFEWFGSAARALRRAVRANFSVVPSRHMTTEVERADAWLAALPRWQWQTIRWREGSQGWLRANSGRASLARRWRWCPACRLVDRPTAHPGRG